jgi:hypothetical protein
MSNHLWFDKIPNALGHTSDGMSVRNCPRSLRRSLMGCR